CDKMIAWIFDLRTLHPREINYLKKIESKLVSKYKWTCIEKPYLNQNQILSSLVKASPHTILTLFSQEKKFQEEQINLYVLYVDELNKSLIETLLFKAQTYDDQNRIQLPLIDFTIRLVPEIVSFSSQFMTYLLNMRQKEEE